MKEGQFSDWWAKGQKQLIKQAERQLQAAGGTPIEWHVAEKEVVPAFEQLLKEAGYPQIKVIHMPGGA